MSIQRHTQQKIPGITLLQLRHLLLACALIVVAACGDDNGTLSRLDSHAVILAFGDSLTYGTGTQPQYSYPSQLAARTGLTVINAGVPGELSAAGRERLPSLLAKHQPDLLLLCHAGNDILRRRDADAAADNLAAMIATARANGSEVLLIAVPEPALLPSAAPFYSRVAQATGTPLLNDALADILSSSSLKADAVHPNRAGYEKLTTAIIDKLHATGAL